MSGCRVTVLLFLLLLSTVSEAQSGDGDASSELGLSCSSHILIESCSLTCKVVGGDDEDDEADEADEDDEADGVEKMTVCYVDYITKEKKKKCVEADGGTVSSSDLNAASDYNVTAQLKRGGTVTKIIKLTNIVKPRSPQVWNVTLDQESNQVLIHIRTPYHKQYLKVKNQLFQLHIWNSSSRMTQNISSVDHVVMKINMELLRTNSQYHVKVRAIPQEFLQGFWSEWSETFSFSTPAGEDEMTDSYMLIVCLVLLAAVTSSVVLFWKNKIFAYMWPSIPHPKHTLVQICKPNKGLLLNFKPEVFSALKVYPLEKKEEQPCEETKPSISVAAAEDTQSNPTCSTQSSDCSRSTDSATTEELELSALLSRSSSDGEDNLQSTSPSPIQVLQLQERPITPQLESSGEGHEAEECGVNQQEEAYVTMSSFYQIK